MRPGTGARLFDLIGSAAAALAVLLTLAFGPGITTAGDQLMCGLGALSLIAVSIWSARELRKISDYDKE